jgi:hypothetical protein
MIIGLMIKSDGIKKDKRLLKEIEELLNGAIKESTTDSDIINYGDWLSSKIS